MDAISSALTLGLGYLGCQWLGGKVYDLFCPPQQTWADQCRHDHYVGESGSGKSTRVLHHVKRELEAGRQVFVFDAHGDLCKDIILRAVPEGRMGEVVYHRPATHPLGFNPLAMMYGTETEKTLIVSHMKEFAKLMVAGTGVVQEEELKEAVWEELDKPHPSLPALVESLDPERQKGLRARLKKLMPTPSIEKAWAAPPVPLQDIGIYLCDMGDLPDEAKEVWYACHLLRGKQLVMNGVRQPLDIFCDEVQMAPRAAYVLAYGLAQFRKFNCALIVAHQWEAQIESLAESWEAFGNQHWFCLNHKDAAAYKHLLEPNFPVEKMTTLPAHQCVERLIMHGHKEQPRLIRTLPPPPKLRSEAAIEKVILSSYDRYGIGRTNNEAHHKGPRHSVAYMREKGSIVTPTAPQILPKLQPHESAHEGPVRLRLSKTLPPTPAGGLGERLLTRRPWQAAGSGSPRSAGEAHTQGKPDPKDLPCPDGE